MEALFPLQGKRIWVAGHTGMVGSALVRRLRREPCQILTVDHGALDLRDSRATLQWVGEHKPDAIVVAAARVGGILANRTQPGDFLYDNLMIGTNVIHAAFRCGVAKVLFLASNCVYPREAPQPMPEGALLGGPLEPTNEAYAIAKIACIKLCQAYRSQHGCDFISVMPACLFGPGDNYELDGGHVMAALIHKTHVAKVRGDRQVVVWGTGTPRREFLHVDDCADACIFLLQRYSSAEPINIGSGADVTILELAQLIAEVVKYSGSIATDSSKPDGMPRKLLNVAKLAGMGWSPKIPLRDGIAATYREFCELATTSAVPVDAAQ